LENRQIDLPKSNSINNKKEGVSPNTKQNKSNNTRENTNIETEASNANYSTNKNTIETLVSVYDKPKSRDKNKSKSVKVESKIEDKSNDANDLDYITDDSKKHDLINVENNKTEVEFKSMTPSLPPVKLKKVLKDDVHSNPDWV